MKIITKKPYGIHSAKTSGSTDANTEDGSARTSGALVAGVSPRASSAIVGVAEAVFAVALWSPLGFKERHPVWGTLFGAGAAFNLIDAIVP